jgi:signal transduction histidine kinase
MSSVILIIITLNLMMAFAVWSWLRHRRLGERRRDAERALRATEERLRQVSSQLPVAHFEYVAVPEPAFRFLSEGIARLLPARAGDVLDNAQVFFDSIDPADCAGLRWRQGGAEAGGEFEWVGRSVPSADGSVRWLQIRANTEIATDGTPVILGVMLDVTALKLAQEALEQSREELRRLAQHRDARVEQERARLAREVHDELGQVLTAARMQLQLLRGELAAQQPADPAERITVVESLIGEAYRSVKSIAADLRPAALNLGLTAAVEWLAERLLQPAGIVAEIRFSAEADQLDEQRTVALFRIVQESLANIVRHAGASRVELRFAAEGNHRCLTIRDDGRGFDPATVDRGKHFGLLGMVERAQALGGALVITSTPGAGTTLTLELAT